MEKKLAGYRCEVHMPDGTVLVRKHATTPYEWALCRKQMLPGVITERWGWKLLGMSSTMLGAHRLVRSRGPEGSIDEVFPVLAIPRYVTPRPHPICDRCNLPAARVEEVPMHGWTAKMCQHCAAVAYQTGEAV